MKNSLLLAFTSILISILLTNSATSSNELNLENEQEEVIKFSEVENVPIYPGCVGTQSEKRECVLRSIASFAQQTFNTELTINLKLTGFQRITTAFDIDKKGNITNIRVRAPHPILKDEAIRVINLLPKMKPGRQNGNAVSVEYLLPIIFKAAPFKMYGDSLDISKLSQPLSNNNLPNSDNEKPVSLAKIESVPVYPGCKGNNLKKRKCMSDKIRKLVQKEFNIGLCNELNLTGMQRISVIFKIDKNGNVIDIRARAPHPRLVKEAIRVLNMLPKMKPGIQRGKPVVVPYSLPINFQAPNQTFVLPSNSK